jgi:beta-glucosidase
VRSTAERFAEYALVIAEQLGDRVSRWITLNEPQVSADHGYRTGVHAPGLTDDAAAAAATHHLLLAHGLGTQALRSVRPAIPVGITLDMHPVRLAAGTQSDLVEAARVATDAELNGLFLEPVLHGRYPEHVRPSLLPTPEVIADGDLETIRQPIDFLGVNYYSPIFLRAGDPDDLRRDEEPARCQLPGVVEYGPADLERTPMGWLVDADGLYELLVQLSDAAPGLPLYITENGCAAEDYVDPDGDVKDVDRISYLHQHLDAAARAIKAGVNLAGYYVWSLLDNFEWGWGYQRRFGIIFVDFETQRRIPKASARFYSEVVRANAIPPYSEVADSA